MVLRKESIVSDAGHSMDTLCGVGGLRLVAVGEGTLKVVPKDHVYGSRWICIMSVDLFG